MKNKDNLISIQKCKRIIRPLLSRIHSINESKSRDPSITIINLPGVFFRSTEKFGSNEINQDSLDCWEPKKKKTKPLKEKSPSPIDPFVGFIKPSTSQSRLQSLKPYVSYELFQAYIDIFQVFRNIITTLLKSSKSLLKSSKSLLKSPKPLLKSPPNLSTLCCYKIGKEITLSTKSTYYKLNQVLLFDQKGVSKELQTCQKDLHDEIDTWLESEPALLMENYRIDLVLGYVIHLVVFNSHLLYMLIPVLLHWLQEMDNYTCRSVMRTLFHEFWNQSHDYADIDTTTMMVLNGEMSEQVEVFWALENIGYWRQMVLDLNLKSNVYCTDQYSSLVLDTLPLNNKLAVLKRFDFIERVYEHIKECPQHPNVNTILIFVVTHIITRFRSLLRSCTTSTAIYIHLKEAVANYMLFVTHWIAFLSCVVFNSLYPGNRAIFQALLKFIEFVTGKIILVLGSLKKHIYHLEDIMEKEKYMRLLRRFDDLGAKSKTRLVALDVLRIYYLDTNEPIDISPYTPLEIGLLIIGLIDSGSKAGLSGGLSGGVRGGVRGGSRSLNSEFNDFLSYLHYKKHPLAQVCFKIFYGKHTKNNDIDDLRHILYN